MSRCVGGSECTFFINAEGNVYSSGYSDYGQHGHEVKQVFTPTMIPTLTNIKSIVVGSTHTVCLDNDGNVYSFGGNDYSQLGIDSCTLNYTHIPKKLIFPFVNKFLVLVNLQFV